MRRFVVLAALVSFSCAKPATQGVSGVIRDANGPVRNATVHFQYFATAACRDLGSSTRELTPPERDEFARCTRDITPVATDSAGAFAVAGLAPGWYSMNVRWTIDQKPAVAAPNTVVDGFVIIYMETRSMPPRYIINALATTPLELKAGDQVTRDFTFRP